MNPRLIKSSLFSLGVHTLLLIPIFSLGSFLLPAETDVTRGTSSVELDLLPEKVEGPVEEKAWEEPTKVLPQEEPWVMDPGAIWKNRSSGPFNPAPQYPWQARVKGWEGTVLLEVWVTPLGRADSVRVSKSSGFPVLDGAALAALRQWRFIPARKKGNAVASVVEVPITFRLDKSEQGS